MRLGAARGERRAGEEAACTGAGALQPRRGECVLGRRCAPAGHLRLQETRRCISMLRASSIRVLAVSNRMQRCIRLYSAVFGGVLESVVREAPL